MPTFADTVPGTRDDPTFSLAASSTPLLIANTDGMTAQNDPDDPHSIANGDHTDDANVIVLPTRGLPYVRGYDLISGAGAITQETVVRCFGLLPVGNTTERIEHRLQNPAEWDATNFDAPTEATLQFAGVEGKTTAGYWVPLTSPVNGQHALTGTSTPEADKDSTAGSAKVLRVAHNNRIWSCSGVTHVMFPIATALAGPTASVFAVRFSNA